jgi:hypothetical protein
MATLGNVYREVWLHEKRAEKAVAWAVDVK